MTIVQYVTGLIASITSTKFTFLYGWKSWQNLKADEIKGEICILDLPIQCKPVITRTGYIQRNFSLLLFFAKQEALDSKPEDLQEDIALMAQGAKEFMTRLFNDKENIDGKTIQNISETDTYFVYDSALCGWVLGITFSVYDNSSIC